MSQLHSRYLRAGLKFSKGDWEMEEVRSKVKELIRTEDGALLWRLRKRIMLGLFDLGRLIIDDPRKLKAFHDEIAAICNTFYDRVKQKVEQNGYDEKDMVAAFLEYKQRWYEREGSFYEREGSEPADTLYTDLKSLMTFMYGDPKDPRADGFLERAQKLIDEQFERYYGWVSQ